MGFGKLDQPRDPVKALLVMTRESSGCFGGQKILRDATKAILGGEAEEVQVEGVLNPEDREDRVELYLFFSAEGVMDEGGYLLLRLGLESGTAGERRTLTVRRASLASSGDALSFDLTAKSRGRIHPVLLYTQGWQVFGGIFTCPAAGLFEPQSLDFLPAYAIATGLEMNTGPLDQNWDRITIPVSGAGLREGRKVALCASLLQRMTRELAASAQSPFVWEKSRVSSEGLRRFEYGMEKEKGAVFQVKVMVHRPTGMEEITSSPEGFDPCLRQPVALVDASGQASGGEVWIGFRSDGS